MTESNNTKKRPDYIAYAAIERSGQPPKFARIGVGFTYKNGSIGLLYDAIPLSGQLIVVDIDDELPATVSYGSPTTAPAFEANLVRENGKDSFWTTVGSAYRQEGYISLICPVYPRDGKLVLTQPKQN